MSASRRTDIPAFYSDWLFNRLGEGFALVHNPMAPGRISRVNLSPGVVDGIVFWTKNPIPMMGRLGALRDYAYCFQFTLTPYGQDVEPGLPEKADVLIPAFQRLSDAIGPGRVVWRYDPILLNPVYTMEFHMRGFEAMAKRLRGYADTCAISFVDACRNTAKNMDRLKLAPIGQEEQLRLAKHFADVARGYGISVVACAEELDMSPVGVGKARCVDVRRFEAMLGCRLAIGKDKGQRPACGCAESVDIGMYNTCPHGCLYCYANYSAGEVAKHAAAHDPASPLLFGGVRPGDEVIERAMFSCRQGQLRFPDA